MPPMTLEQRLERLEREVRHWRVGVALGVVALGALSLGVAVLASSPAGAADAKQRLTLVSPDHRQRLQLDPTGLTITADDKDVVVLSGAPTNAPGCVACGRVGLWLDLPGRPKGQDGYQPLVDLSATTTRSYLSLNPPTAGADSTTLSAP